jgi:NADPH:quinone reductase-like Zn-dependent oxidoreductase
MPGQDVFGLAHGCLGTIVRGPASMLAPMPPGISYSEAATAPTVCMTAEVALRQLAGVQAGERVLVHAAAGGVGLAALQLIGAAGAVPCATAGSPYKRALLRSLGCAAVVGSRDTGFAAQLAQLGGVAVVLNSLTSPGMVAASLAALQPGGRLVEIGKRDIWSSAAAAAERPDVSYSLLAVDFLPDHVLGGLMAAVAASLAAGQLLPLRAACFDLASVAAAMRQLAQASHVGKVLTGQHMQSCMPAPPPHAPAGVQAAL